MPGVKCVQPVFGVPCVMESADSTVLAIAENEPTAPVAQTQSAHCAASSWILLVDDNAGSRNLLAIALTQKGYLVSTAADGATALALMQAQRFDMVLLDVNMPDISGLHVLKQIRQRFSPTELPVIMTTGNDQSADIVQALGMGANDYVTKPLDFAVTIARIRTHLQLKYTVEHVLDLETRLTARNIELETANAELRENTRQ